MSCSSWQASPGSLAKALSRAQRKLPIKTHFVVRENGDLMADKGLTRGVTPWTMPSSQELENEPELFSLRFARSRWQPRGSRSHEDRAALRIYTIAREREAAAPQHW